MCAAFAGPDCPSPTDDIDVVIPLLGMEERGPIFGVVSMGSLDRRSRICLLSECCLSRTQGVASPVAPAAHSCRPG